MDGMIWMDGWMDGIQQIVYVQGHSFKSMICMNLLQIITIGIDKTKKETRGDEKETRGMRGKKKTRKENVKFITNRKETKREKWRVVLTPPSKRALKASQCFLLSLNRILNLTKPPPCPRTQLEETHIVG